MSKIKHIFIPGIVDGELEVPDEVIASLVEAYLANHPETDPTVPSWAKQPSKPTYTASEVGAYSKPSGGIPASDLASAVQTSLGKADTALQQHQSLTGYATETWVQNRGYQTAQDVQAAINGVRQLPAVSTTDNGKFLRVSNGAWAAETVSTWQGGSY